MELDGRRALVTGGASGLGLGIARALAGAGADLCLVDLDPEGARRALEETGGRGVAVGADVSRFDDVEEAVRAAREHLGGIDILVNNAGIAGEGEPKLAHETSAEEWSRVLAVNLTGPFLLCRAVLPDMLSRGRGIIINVASAAGLVGLPGRSPYAASKAGLLHLTRTIAAEYASRGIRANALCPGWIATPMTAWRLRRREERAAVESRIPMGRVATVEEIADAALFLASRASRYMTGAALVVDGGWVAV